MALIVEVVVTGDEISLKARPFLKKRSTVTSPVMATLPQLSIGATTAVPVPLLVKVRFSPVANVPLVKVKIPEIRIGFPKVALPVAEFKVKFATSLFPKV